MALSGAAARGAALLGTALLAACAAQRPPAPPLSTPPPQPYRARFQMTVEAGRRGFSLPAGAALDPARGARIELRDPMGGARLLLLLTERAGRLFHPDSSEEARWSGASPSLPWSPADLWSLLVATPPASATALKRDPAARPLSASWPGDLGTVKARFIWDPTRPFPPAEASLKGPGAARLTVVWSDVLPGEVPEAAFSAPEGAGAVVPLEDLLAEVSR